MAKRGVLHEALQESCFAWVEIDRTRNAISRDPFKDVRIEGSFLHLFSMCSWESTAEVREQMEPEGT